ncbi:nuclear transport factor 2 family protein [Streptomyces tanashiensis]
MGALLGMLAPDVVFHGDGGGKARAPGEPQTDPRRIVRLLVGGLRKVGNRRSLHPAQVDGRPGAVLRDAEGRVASVLELDIADGVVRTIRSVSNPDKLTHLGPVSDVGRRSQRLRAVMSP